MSKGNFLPLPEEKKLLSKTIKMESKGKYQFATREDYDNKPFIEYFWKNFEEKPSIHWSIPGQILYFSVSLFFCIFLLILTGFTVFLILNFGLRVGDLISFLIIVVFFAWIAIKTRKTTFNEFNIKPRYFLILGLGLFFSLVIVIIFFDLYYTNLVTPLGTYFLTILLLLLFHTRSKRILGAGKLYLHGIAILVDLESEKKFPQIWDRYISNDISGFVKGWDELIGGILNYRLKNIDDVIEGMHERVVLDTANFKKAWEMLLEQSFFDLIKKFYEGGNVIKISSLIKEKLNLKPEFTLNTLVQRLKRKISMFNLIIILLGLLTGIFSILDLFIFP